MIAARPLDEAALDRGVERANLPALLMVLHQLTGDARWLSDPYRPSRARGMDDNDTGGFDVAAQAEIRGAARSALRAWSAGRPVARPAPQGALLRTMMLTCTGERRMADGYDDMMAEEMGFADVTGPASMDPTRLRAQGFQVVVIGAGIGGLLSAHLLQRAGIPVTVLEKSADIGGTWLANRYPGAGVDTPSYLYSFSFFRRDWSTYFPKRDEVLDYLRDFADTFGLRPLVRFGTEVRGARYDEVAQRWEVGCTTADGTYQTMTATAVISAVGIFDKPFRPAITGLDGFAGEVFHSAEWPEDCDVGGRRVAVIGSGASAMQIVPAIAGRAQRISIFQRSPMWVAPSAQYALTVAPEIHWLMNNVPYYHEWYRFQLAWMYNDRIYPSLHVDPGWPHPDRSLNVANDRHRELFTRYIAEQLSGRPDLLAKAVPTYPPFGKRMLIDNGWYAALRRPDVELLAEGCARTTADTVIGNNGSARPADLVVLCTGFRTQSYLSPMDFLGRDGRSLRAEWGEDDARAHLGLTAPGYPNLFMVYGPATNGAGGSYLTFAESQVGYIVELIRLLAEGRAGAVEPRQDVVDAYNERLDRAHESMVWTHPGMSTYYRNARGRVVVNRPWSVLEYWRLTREPALDDYALEPVSRRPAAGRDSR